MQSQVLEKSSTTRALLKVTKKRKMVKLPTDRQKCENELYQLILRRDTLKRNIL